MGGDAARSMTVYQSEDNKATQPGTGSVASVSLEVKDTQNPVYIYGGSSNKQIFAVIVEYYADGAGDLEDEIKDIDTPVQFVDWGGAKAVLTKNDLTDNTKVWIQDSNGTMTQLSTEYFAEADVAYNANDKYTINALAVYKDRLYASCDNGLVIVFTSCQKCYKLKKVSDFDNKTMTIENDIMTVSDGINKKEIEMGSIGGNSIEPDEANVLLANGAKLIDVRTAEEFEEKWAIDSINIPLDTLETGLSIYDKSTPLIFACASGVRAESAVKKALELG
ncbi:MAG: rhodanese-like domain-containing protein [Christensenellales bacterium]